MRKNSGQHICFSYIVADANKSRIVLRVARRVLQWAVGVFADWAQSIALGCHGGGEMAGLQFAKSARAGSSVAGGVLTVNWL